MDSEPVPNVRCRKLQRAVIEAAEALRRRILVTKGGSIALADLRVVDLCWAVEAMQAGRSE